MRPLDLPLGMEPTDRKDVVNTTGSYTLGYVPSGAHQPSVNITCPTNVWSQVCLRTIMSSALIHCVSLGSLGTLQCTITRLLIPWAPPSHTGALIARIKAIFSKRMFRKHYGILVNYLY